MVGPRVTEGRCGGHRGGRAWGGHGRGPQAAANETLTDASRVRGLGSFHPGGPRTLSWSHPRPRPASSREARGPRQGCGGPGPARGRARQHPVLVTPRSPGTRVCSQVGTPRGREAQHPVLGSQGVCAFSGEREGGSPGVDHYPRLGRDPPCTHISVPSADPKARSAGGGGGAPDGSGGWGVQPFTPGVTPASSLFTQASVSPNEGFV